MMSQLNAEAKEFVPTHTSSFSLGDSVLFVGANESRSWEHHAPPRARRRRPRQQRKHNIAYLPDHDIAPAIDLPDLVAPPPAPKSPYLIAAMKEPSMEQKHASETKEQDQEKQHAAAEILHLNRMVKSADFQALEKHKSRWMEITSRLAKVEKTKLRSPDRNEDEDNADNKSVQKEGRSLEVWHKILNTKQSIPFPAFPPAASTPVKSPTAPSTSNAAAAVVYNNKALVEQWWQAVFANSFMDMMKCLEHGINFDIRYEDNNLTSLSADGSQYVGLTALHILAKLSTHLLSLEALLQLPAINKNVDIKDRIMKRSSLHFACEHGNLDGLKLLARWTRDLNPRDRSGDTPLHLACHHNHQSIVYFLLDKTRKDQVKINLRNKKGQHALLLATHRNIVTALIDHGADLTLEGSDGLDVLCQAAKQGHASIVKAVLSCNSHKIHELRYVIDNPLPSLLIDSNSNSNKLMQYTTPLHQASISGHELCMQMLLQTGWFDVNAVDQPKLLTPLMHAAYHNHIASFLLLIQHGAIGGRKNSDGLSEISVAAVRGHGHLIREVADFVKRYGIGMKIFKQSRQNEEFGYNCLSSVLQYLIKAKTITWDGHVLTTLGREVLLERYCDSFAALISGGVTLSYSFVKVTANEFTRETLLRFNVLNEVSLSSVATGALNDLSEIQMAMLTLSINKEIISRVSIDSYSEDIEFILENDVHVLAHSLMFRRQSALISAMMDSEMTEIDPVRKVKYLKFMHVDEYLFISIKRFVYEGVDVTTSMTMNQVIELLYAANAMLLDHLQVLCEERLYLMKTSSTMSMLQEVSNVLYLPTLTQLLQSKHPLPSALCVNPSQAYYPMWERCKSGAFSSSPTLPYCLTVESNLYLARQALVITRTLPPPVEGNNATTASCPPQHKITFPISNTRPACTSYNQHSQWTYEGEMNINDADMFLTFLQTRLALLDGQHYDTVIHCDPNFDLTSFLASNKDRSNSWSEDTKCFKVHRAVLHAHSRKLQAMTDFEEQQGKIIRGSNATQSGVPDTILMATTRPLVTQLFVLFCYTGLILLPPLADEEEACHILLELAVLGDEYLMESLREHSSALLIQRLNASLVSMVHEVACAKELHTIRVMSVIYFLKLIAASSSPLSDMVAETDAKDAAEVSMLSTENANSVASDPMVAYDFVSSLLRSIIS